MTALVDIKDLKVNFTTDRHVFSAVNGVNLRISPRKTICLVGESGCGKSVTAKAILRIVEQPGYIAGGSIRVSTPDGAQLDIASLKPGDQKLRSLRGNEIAMIHQEPMSFLSPLYTIGNQISEAIRLHKKVSKKDAGEIAIDMLRQVGMPAPEERFDYYTFQLSGGQRQRAMIAMALVCKPRLLIADEPTTALDVTTQANILDLLRKLRDESGMAMLFITHDLGVVEEIADEVAVMYLGRIVEQGPAERIFTAPKHPYTRGLLDSMPRLDGDLRAPLEAIPGAVPSPAETVQGCSFHPRCKLALAGLCDRLVPEIMEIGQGHIVACHAFGSRAAEFTAAESAASASAPVATREASSAPVLMRVEGLTRHFPVRAGFLARTVDHVRAVTDVSLEIRDGETLGLVGESGCGKSTLGQLLVGLHNADSGTVAFRNDSGNLEPLSSMTRKRRYSDVRMIFQDPVGSLNPRRRVRDIIGEVLTINTSSNRAEVDRRVGELLEQVGLSVAMAERYPHAFSGGQRQRVAIARALAPMPRLVIADEAVSALDVSVQTQIINLMQELQRQYRLTYLFISHNLGVVAKISDRVAVMYAGRIVEIGQTEEIFRTPRHPYTEALLAAIPGRGKRGAATYVPRIEGQAPSRGSAMNGCAFAARCSYSTDRCLSELPVLRRMDHAGQQVACHRADELDLSSPMRVAAG